MENAGAATPFKMHPVTTMSEQDQRVADYRREVSKFMKAAKEAVKKGNGEAALKSLQRAEKLIIGEEQEEKRGWDRFGACAGCNWCSALRCGSSGLPY